MTLELRYYQREAIDAAYRHLRERSNNPCIVLPTGAGKTPVMSSICDDVVSQWSGRVLVLSHVKELIEQTVRTLGSWFPDLSVGAYSAGLNRRETKTDVVVAGIQSVHKKGLKISGTRPFNIVLIDEAHRIPTDGDGMYRTLLTDLTVANPKIRVIGLTATPYRLKGGYVCGPDHFLNEICYEAGVRELIAKGYLSRLTSKQTNTAIDASKLGVRSGEYKKEDLSEAFDSDEVVQAACREIAQRTIKRKSVLLFCCSVDHARHVSETIEHETGQSCGIVTGETPSDERAQAIERFMAGEMKFLANVNVLTEGFDATMVDCVCLLRATLSPGLYYQMVGRGLRLHPGKTDCLVLDFGGNVMRHGCIDAIKIKTPASGGGGEAPTRVCPECNEIVSLVFSSCPECGAEFPEKKIEQHPRHEARAAEAPITTDELKPITYPVTRVSYMVHTKKGSSDDTPKTMRVTYFDGFEIAAEEWICVEHTGFAFDKAEAWWSQRCKLPMPATAEEAVETATIGYLSEPSEIKIIKPPGERFAKIVQYEMSDIPEPDEVLISYDEWGNPMRWVESADEEVPF